MARGGKLLLVEDDQALAEPLAEYLEGLGHAVRLAATLGAARQALAEAAPELVLLDLTLGHESGLALLRELGALRIPALIITGRAGSMERIIALELGADDVLEKPFELRELAARVAGLLRRRTGRERELLRLERVSVDLRAALVLQAGGATLRLSHGEVALLRALLAHPGEVLSREALLEAAPAEEDGAEARSIDQRIARLRQKLDTEAIETLRGHGYRLLPPRG